MEIFYTAAAAMLLFLLSFANGSSAVSAFQVIVASKFGLPVSTTHVSASSIMGIGLADNKGLNLNTVKSMLLAWVVTVPASAAFGAIIYYTGKLCAETL